MEKYENLGLVGEGSYGMVLKCKHKETGQCVAIKKFLESEDDKMVKKIALREVRMLKQLRHENLVNLIEVFRRKKRLYLVFEFVDHTVLDDLERCPNGLDDMSVRKVLWQVLRGIEFCHKHNIIHRDIKPENILVSRSGVVKLCDFGFARTLAQPGEAYTDYVATRWYRAPELLVGDTKYGRAVDIWAVGCLTAEMLTGDPLFPGDSDIDQLFHVVKCFGSLTPRQREIFHKNSLFVNMRLPEVRELEPLEKKFPRINQLCMDLMKQCLRLEANDRPTCTQLLRHEFFTNDGFAQKFPQEIKARIQKENQGNPLLRPHRGSGANHHHHHDDDDKKDGEVARKKKKERKECKENDEEKPKRKLPDPEKFIKKASPPGTSPHNRAPPKPTAQVVEVAESTSPTAIMPPIQTTSPQNVCHTTVRVNDKMKKNVAGGQLFKKNPAPAHHSHTMSPPPTLQAEKSSLHEKTLAYDKMTNTKKRGVAAGKEDVGAAVKSKSKDGLCLPEVRGAEANPHKNKTKKNIMVGTVPHITNLDPFSDPQGSPDKDNFPAV